MPERCSGDPKTSLETAFFFGGVYCLGAWSMLERYPGNPKTPLETALFGACDSVPGRCLSDAAPHLLRAWLTRSKISVAWPMPDRCSADACWLPGRSEITYIIRAFLGPFSVLHASPQPPNQKSTKIHPPKSTQNPTKSIKVMSRYVKFILSPFYVWCPWYQVV